MMIEEKSIENLGMVRLNIQLTKKCNQRCKSCNSYTFSTEDEMSTDVIITAIKDICQHFSINNVAFTGGEPTVHKDILKIAETAKKYSPNVSITTNGFYCTKKERVRELIHSGINRFSFSYHGVGMQDTFTGVQGSEARIRKAIEWVCEERQNNPDIYVKIGTLFDGNNIENVGKVLDYAEDVGVDLYIELLDDQLPIFKNTEFNKAIPGSGIKEALNTIDLWRKNGRSILLDDAGYHFMKLYFTDRSTIVGSCPLGKTDIYIESNGKVRTGCWSMSSVGNIVHTKFEEIYKGKAYNDNLQRMLARQCSGCTCGYLMQGKYIRMSDSEISFSRT